MADQRGRIRGRANDHRLFHALLTERLLDEVLHLATTLADQTADHDLRLAVASDLPHQRRLADARAGEESDTLAEPDRQQPVDRAHAKGEVLGDPISGHRLRRISFDRPRLESAALDRIAIERFAKPAQHSAEERFTAADFEGSARRDHLRVGSDTDRRSHRHQEHIAVAKPDDLGFEHAAGAVDLDQLTDAHAGHRRLDHQTGQLDHASPNAGQLGRLHPAHEALEADRGVVRRREHGQYASS